MSKDKGLETRLQIAEAAFKRNAQALLGNVEKPIPQVRISAREYRLLLRRLKLLAVSIRHVVKGAIPAADERIAEVEAEARSEIRDPALRLKLKLPAIN